MKHLTLKVDLINFEHFDEKKETKTIFKDWMFDKMVAVNKGFEFVANLAETTSPLRKLFKPMLIVISSDQDIQSPDWFINIEQGVMRGAENKLPLPATERDWRVIATSSRELTPNCFLSDSMIEQFAAYYNEHEEIPYADFDYDEIEPRMSINGIAQFKWMPKEQVEKVPEQQPIEAAQEPPSGGLSFRDILVSFFRDGTKSDYLQALNKAELDLSAKFISDQMKTKFSNDLDEVSKELSEHWYQKTGSMTAREICTSSFHTGYSIGFKQKEKYEDLLLECELQLVYLNQKFGETGTTNALIPKIKTTLNK